MCTHKEMLKMTKQPTLNISDAIRCIRTYYNETIRDEHGRYMSWCHCYNAYGECRGVTDDKTIDPNNATDTLITKILLGH